MSKSIIDIYARRGKRGGVERFDFSGAEAKKEIDQYIDTIKATKADLDADKAASAEYADRAESASSSAEQFSSSAAGNAADAISASKNAKKSADNAANTKSSVDISEGNAASAAAAAKAWAVGPSGTSEEGTDTNNAKYWAEIAKNSVSPAGVNSWNGRSGAVTPQEGDYTAEMVGALPSEGTAVAADKLSSVREITANLETEGGSSFDGTQDVSVGVTGTLPVTHGGTGGSTASAARKALGVPSTDTASTSANGLMSSTDKGKLDGIAEGANNTEVDDTLSSSSMNPVQNKVVNEAIAKIHEKLDEIDDGANKTIVDAALSETSTNPVQNKVINEYLTTISKKLDGVEEGANKTVVDEELSATSTNPLQNKVISALLTAFEEKLGGIPKVLPAQSLTASGGTLTFKDASITENSLITPWTTVYGISPTKVVATAGTCTVTFDAQDSAFDACITVRN